MEQAPEQIRWSTRRVGVIMLYKNDRDVIRRCIYFQKKSGLQDA